MLRIYGRSNQDSFGALGRRFFPSFTEYFECVSLESCQFCSAERQEEKNKKKKKQRKIEKTVDIDDVPIRKGENPQRRRSLHTWMPFKAELEKSIFTFPMPNICFYFSLCFIIRFC